MVEVTAVIAIIGLLIALLLPAVQACRESTRKAQCANNLSQLGMALQSYQSAHEVLPPGVADRQGPILSIPRGYHMSWIAQILPHMEQQPIYGYIDFRRGAYDKQNAAARAETFPGLRCPSDVSRGKGLNNYAACHHDVEAPIDKDNHGVFFLNSRLRSWEIPDGASYTIFLGEKRCDEWDYGWISGTRSTLRNTGTRINGTVLPPLGPWKPPLKPADDQQPAEKKEPPPADLEPGGPDGFVIPGLPIPPETVFLDLAPINPADQLMVGGFGSYHPGVANFLFGDGSVRPLSEMIEQSLYEQLGHREDGKLPTQPY